MTAVGVGVFSRVITVQINHAGLVEPESGPFITSIGFIVLMVAVLVAGVVTLVVAVLVVKRKAVQTKKARNYNCKCGNKACSYSYEAVKAVASAFRLALCL